MGATIAAKEVAFDLSSVQRTSFVGREAELEALGSQLARGHRLLTVLGAPGVGKTRLVLELAARRLRRQPGSIWVADVGRATTAGEISAAVADAIGAPAPDPVSELRARGPATLIVDGFEQLIECAPATIGAWLAQVPELTVIAGSRRRLGRSGEVLFELSPLAPSEAFELFVARMQLARPDAVLDDSQRVLVEELVAELDGLPLAIELAAARLRVLSLPALTALAARSKDILTLLVDEGRRGRGGSLEAEIERSWKLLQPPQQRALVACSAFEGAFPLEAAEGVLDDDAPKSPLDALQALRDHSLLLAAPPDGYRLLKSVRAFAQKQIAELASEPASDALIVTASGRRIRVPGSGWVSLPKGSPLALILLCLTESHVEHPGKAVSLDELVCAGWPDERILPEAARNRGYMALSRLRKLGLGELIRRSEDGYFLDPALAVSRMPE